MPSAVVDVFEAQTMTWSTTTLSQARAYLCAMTVGTKVIFAGGGIQDAPLILSDRVDIYDASLGSPGNPAAWSTATLSSARVGLAAVSVGSQALFAGGYEGSGLFGTALVDIYDVQTSTWSTATLSTRRSGLSAAAVGNTVLFAGGWQNTTSHVASPIVDILDATTGNWLEPSALSRAHTYIDAVTVDGKVLFAGGKLGSGNGTTELVDVFEDAPPVIPCPAAVTRRDSMGGTPGTLVSFSATATDDLDPAPSVVCVPPSGSFFPRGTTMVTCTATDLSGNQSVFAFPVTVQLSVRAR